MRLASSYGDLPLALLLAFGAGLLVLWVSRPRKAVVRFKWTAPKEASLSWEGEVLDQPSLHCHDHPALTKRTLTCYSPAQGAFLATLPACTPLDVSLSIDRARAAAPKWAATTFPQRRAIMRSLLEWVVRDMQSLTRVCARDTGKTLCDAAFGEIYTTASKLEWLIKHGEEALRPERRKTNLILAHKTAEVRYEPLGVVAAIVSWNYPLHNLISPIVAALFAGNAIIVKPSEMVAWSSQSFTEAIRSCLEAHGHDPELVQVLIGAEKDAGEALSGDARIQHMTFIGSEFVGRQVAARCGESGTQVCLELGGKDPAILLPSTDLKAFLPTLMRAAFQSAGQNCIGTERFIVHTSLYDRFIEGVFPYISALRVGDPLDPTSPQPCDIGAMVTDARFEELEALISEAVKAGAKLMIGGKRLEHRRFPKGHYFQPTLIVDVTPAMPIAQTELFAPVMLVMRYHTLDEGIEIANGTRYSLAASVYGKSKRDCEYVVSRLRAGQVSVNDFGAAYLAQSLPFGGVGCSGFGRFGGAEGLRALCSTKAILRDRVHGVIQTTIPPPLRYPISEKGTFYSQIIAELVWGSWKRAIANVIQ